MYTYYVYFPLLYINPFLPLQVSIDGLILTDEEKQGSTRRNNTPKVKQLESGGAGLSLQSPPSFRAGRAHQGREEAGESCASGMLPWCFPQMFNSPQQKHFPDVSRTWHVFSRKARGGPTPAGERNSIVTSLDSAF